MEAKNVCPYCGCDDMISNFVDTYNCRIKCKSCDAVGPVHFGGADGALDAFCHPAHVRTDAEHEIAAIKWAVVDSLDGCTDFEGLPPSHLNYLQCIRKLVARRFVADDEIAIKREMGETLQRLGDVAASHDATYALYSAAKDAFADLTRALEGK